MKLTSKPSLESERNFEKKHILSKRDQYLETDVLVKISTDSGYKTKLELIEKSLGDTKGWVLDVGANTCGEDEYLAWRGFSVISTDINEIALSISKERVQKYSRKGPQYCASDGHSLSIKDKSVDFVIIYESLHHLVNPKQALNEVFRVLSPGGRIFLYEPYKYDPYRKLAEIKDYFKGTVERSFSIGELKKLLRTAGLTPVVIQRSNLPLSSRKMEILHPIRKVEKRFYFLLGRLIPAIFSNVLIIAEKSGEVDSSHSHHPFEDLLVCPKCKSEVQTIQQEIICINKICRLLYPVYKGIPVLIKEDARQLDISDWESKIGKEGK